MPNSFKPTAYRITANTQMHVNSVTGVATVNIDADLITEVIENLFTIQTVAASNVFIVSNGSVNSSFIGKRFVVVIATQTVMLGTVATITNTGGTFVEPAVVDFTGSSYLAATQDINPEESFYLRFAPVEVTAIDCKVPDRRAVVGNNNLANTSYVGAKKASVTGDWDTALETPIAIPIAVEFAGPTIRGNRLPQAWWWKINPNGESSETLYQKTAYDFYIAPTLPSMTISLSSGSVSFGGGI